MTISLIKLPQHSALHNIIEPDDFVDCYYNDDVPKEILVSKAAIIVLTQMPKWVDILMKARDFAVSFIGLKTASNIPDISENEILKVGDYIGIFRVHSITKDEILIGEDDKHLNFLISVLRYEQGFALATWVHTHNWFGRFYLFSIMLFHKLIVRNAVGRLSLAKM